MLATVEFTFPHIAFETDFSYNSVSGDMKFSGTSSICRSGYKTRISDYAACISIKPLLIVENVFFALIYFALHILS